MLDLSEDLKLAQNARQYSKSGTAHYTVGAVLKCKNGKRYIGCNIENDGIQSICAERVAFVKAISEGELEFEHIVVVGAPEGEKPETECTPCGYCRQFMSQYTNNDFKIYTVDKEKVRQYGIKDLLPYGFNF